MSESIVVGIGEIKCARAPDVMLIAPGLGSGIAVCAYDPQARIGAVAHIVLPESQSGDSVAGKFADTAIPSLLQKIVEFGADPERVRIALAGGAELFGFRGLGTRLEIGARNAVAVKLALERANLPVIAADLGGTEGRTIHLTPEGRVYINIQGRYEQELVRLNEYDSVRS